MTQGGDHTQDNDYMFTTCALYPIIIHTYIRRRQWLVIIFVMFTRLVIYVKLTYFITITQTIL